MKKISVIVPIYNKEEYLSECLDSIFSQDLRDIEIICIDDGSLDGSLAAVEAFAERDSRIVVLKQANAGAAEARNHGMYHATGEYIAFMDPDDWYPDSSVLADLYNAAKRAEADICGGSLAESRKGILKSDFKGSDSRYRFEDTGFINFSDYQFDYGFTRFIYRRAFINDNNLRFPSYRKFEDPPFFVAAMIAARKFYALSRITYIYRVGHHAANWTQDSLSDLACGVSDVLDMTARHNLGDLHRAVFRRVEQSYIELFYSALPDSGEGLLHSLERLKDRTAISLVKDDEQLWMAYEAMESLLKIKKLSMQLESDAFDDATNGDLAVTVIIPVFNTEEYILACLRSVTGQSLKNIEILLVDDGSPDHAISLAEPIAERDKRVRVLKKTNGGLSSARNFGLDRARGEYVLFLDSDDMLDPDALRMLYAFAKEHRLDELFYSAEPFFDTYSDMKANPGYRSYYNYSDGYPLVASGQRFFAALSTKSEFKPSACLQLLRREFLARNRISFLNGILHEDNLFTMQCLICSKRTSLLNEPLYKRRVHSGSIMTSQKGVKNSFGYYCAARETIAFLEERNGIVAAEFESLFEQQIERFLNIAADFYRSDETFFKELPYAQRLQFDAFVKTRVDCRRRLQDKERECKSREARVRNSNSFRIGRVVTHIPRKIKRFIQRKRNA